MEQNIQMQQVKNGFIKGLEVTKKLVIVALSLRKMTVFVLVGEHRDISPTSALRLRLGRLLWGRSTGMTQDGRPVDLPDEIFYEVADRKLPYMNSHDPVGTAASQKEVVMHNLIRAQMSEIERRVLKVLVIVLFLVSAAIGGVATFKSLPGMSGSDQYQQYQGR